MTEPLTNTTSRPIQGELKDGVPLAKGVVITEDFLERNETLFQQLCRATWLVCSCRVPNDLQYLNLRKLL